MGVGGRRPRPGLDLGGDGSCQPLVVPAGLVVLCVCAPACAPVLLGEGVVLACVPGSQGSPRPEGGGNREKPRGARVFSPRLLRRPHAWVVPCTEELSGYACPSRPWRGSLSIFFVLEALCAKGWPAVPAQAQLQPCAAALAAAGCPDRAFLGSAHRAQAPWPGIISRRLEARMLRKEATQSCRLLGGWRLRPAKVTQH